MQLQQHLDSYKAAGIGVVAITYDAPELQQAFVDKVGLQYPLISDIDATTFKALGILNPEYPPDHAEYGIPYPGAFVLDSQKNIVGKVFLEGYSTRVNAEGVLAYALEVLD